MGNPFVAGNFFSGEFAGTTEFSFDDPLRDQRQCLLMEIEAIKQTTLLSFAQPLFGGPNMRQAYYYVDTTGTLQSFMDLEGFTNTNDIRWTFSGGGLPVAYLIMMDENNVVKFVTTTFDSTPALMVSGNSPLEFTIDEARFVGPYIELIDENGTGIYRFTVQSDLSIHVDLNRTEPERAQSITVSNGHPFAFRLGRTYPEALIELGDISTEVPASQIGFSGLTQARLGIAKIGLLDGQFDFLTEQDWDGRTVTIYVGSTDERPEIYPIASRAISQSATWDQNTISIRFQDAAALWDRLVHDTYYEGTGGYEGDPEIAGRIKPTIYGEVRIVEPILVLKGLNLYQYHDGSAHGPNGVTQGGVGLFLLGDFPETLLTWIPTSVEIAQGGYRTDNARGMFRLAAPPGGIVTLTEARGDDQLTFGTSFLGRIIQRILAIRVPEITVDMQSFVRFEVFHFQQAGIFFREVTTLRQAMNELMQSAGGALSLDRLNELHISSLQREASKAFLTLGDIVDGSIRRETLALPGTTYRFGYQRAWIVLNQSNFLLGADPMVEALASVEYRYTIRGPFNSAIANRAPNGMAKTINTFLANELATTQFGETITLRENGFRDVYVMTFFGISFRFRIGDVIQVELDRWGLDVPRTFVIIGVRERSSTGSTENLTTLKLWG